MKELLEKLKSLDPTTFRRYDGEIIGETDGNVYASDLKLPAQMAWLQACLQDTVSGKGWFFYIQWDTHYGWMASINEQEEPCAGDSPAKSLLAAYIAACEANR